MPLANPTALSFGMNTHTNKSYIFPSLGQRRENSFNTVGLVAFVVQLLSWIRLFAIPWTVAHQAPLSVGFFRQEYWSGLPFPSPGDLPHPGIETLVSLIARRALYHSALFHLWLPKILMSGSQTERGTRKGSPSWEDDWGGERKDKGLGTRTEQKRGPKSPGGEKGQRLSVQFSSVSVMAAKTHGWVPTEGSLQTAESLGFKVILYPLSWKVLLFQRPLPSHGPTLVVWSLQSPFPCA